MTERGAEEGEDKTARLRNHRHEKNGGTGMTVLWDQNDGGLATSRTSHALSWPAVGQEPYTEGSTCGSRQKPVVHPSRPCVEAGCPTRTVVPRTVVHGQVMACSILYICVAGKLHVADKLTVLHVDKAGSTERGADNPANGRKARYPHSLRRCRWEEGLEAVQPPRAAVRSCTATISTLFDSSTGGRRAN